MNKLIFPVLAVVLLAGSELCFGSEENRIPVTDPIGSEGTLAFLLRTDGEYRNGRGEEPFSQTIIELPGFVSFTLEKDECGVLLSFLWEDESGGERDLRVMLPEFPGPETCHFLFTWNSTEGTCDGYLNGNRLRYPGTRLAPWEIESEAVEIHIPAGPNTVTDVEAFPRYLTGGELHRHIPDNLRDRRAELVGFAYPPSVIDIREWVGEILCETDMSSRVGLEDWIVEGEGSVGWMGGNTIIKSESTDPSTLESGHTILWCPFDLPDSFVAEWDFMPVKKHGMSSIFFAASGENGEDIFNPGLADRSDGDWNRYTHGDINSYHITYYANPSAFRTGHPSCTLQKNNACYHLAQGPIPVLPGIRSFYRMRLIKDGAHIQLLANGRPCLDFTDTGDDRYGSVFRGGKIGFSQMGDAQVAYKDFRVRALAPR